MTEQKLRALAKKLGVRARELKAQGLDRDVSPLVRKILIGQLKRKRAQGKSW